MTVREMLELLQATVLQHGEQAEDWDVKISFEQTYGSSLACNILDSSKLETEEGNEVLMNLEDSVENYVWAVSRHMISAGELDPYDREEFYNWLMEKERAERLDIAEDRGGSSGQVVWLRTSASSGFGNYVAPGWIRMMDRFREDGWDESDLREVSEAWLNYQSDGV